MAAAECGLEAVSEPRADRGLAAGQRIGFPSDEYAPELVWEDHTALKSPRRWDRASRSALSFDFGDGWRRPRRRSTVRGVQRGPLPQAPVATGG
jgi:hypothetical protein